MKSKIDHWAEEIGDAYFNEAISACKRMAYKLLAEAEKLAEQHGCQECEMGEMIRLDDLKALFEGEK